MAWAIRRRRRTVLAVAEEENSRGDFEDSLSSWRAALAESTTDKDSSGQLTAALGLADSLQELGQYRLAEEALEHADGVAKAGTDKRLQARVESSLGTLYMFASDPDDAEGLLTKSLALARSVGDAHLTATTLNNLANLHAYQKNNDQALQEYEEGISQAQDSGDKVLAAKISANLVSCAVQAASWDDAKKWAYQIIADGPHAPDSHDKAMALLSAAESVRRYVHAKRFE